MKRKLGINVECLRGVHYSEALPLIKAQTAKELGTGVRFLWPSGS